jgi:hypothetical protein
MLVFKQLFTFFKVCCSIKLIIYLRKQSTALNTIIEASVMLEVFENRDKNKRSFREEVKLWQGILKGEVSLYH